MRRWNVAFLIAGLLGVTVMLVRLDFGRFAGSVADVGAGFAIAALIHLAMITVDAVTMLLCTSRPIRANFWLALRAFLAGHAINVVTPLGNLGEVTKFTWISERLPREEVAAALLVQNILWTACGLAYFAGMALIAPALLDGDGGLETGLRIAAGVCLLLGGALVLLLRLHLPAWPFALARRFKISEKRVEAARAFLHRVGDETGRFKKSGGRAWLAVALAMASRLLGAGEVAVLLARIEPGIPLVVPMLQSGSTQMISWIFAFVPMSLGTAEGGAYLLFGMLGLSPALGVVLELARKALRLSFVVVGIVVLGLKTLRRGATRA